MENLDNMENLAEESYELSLDDYKNNAIRIIKEKFNKKRVVDIGGGLTFDYDEKSIVFYSVLLQLNLKEVITSDNKIISLTKAKYQELNNICNTIKSKEAVLLRLIKDKINLMESIEDLSNIELINIDDIITSKTLEKYEDLNAFLEENFFIKHYYDDIENNTTIVRKNDENGDIIEIIEY